MYKEIACICSRWHDIGFKLQFSTRELADISTIIETDEDRLKKLCLKWTEREGNKATWQRIGTMLRKIGEFRLADSVDERHDIVSKTHVSYFDNLPCFWIYSSFCCCLILYSSN